MAFGEAIARIAVAHGILWPVGKSRTFFHCLDSFAKSNRDYEARAFRVGFKPFGEVARNWN